MIKKFIKLVRDYYQNKDCIIPLHSPLFKGNEKKYILDTIDSTYVSSVGSYVDKLEEMIINYTGSKFAIATVNGTSALHIALHSLGVGSNHEVITQPLTFVATANAITYTGARPIFLDVDRDTMGLSPRSLENFLSKFTININNKLINKITRKEIKACVPMHTFGIPCRIQEIIEICDKYKISVVEDSAESLGSKVNNKHTGTFGTLGIFSFNGNKIITSGGGGIIIANDKKLAMLIKHLTTTAKVQHTWEYYHDQIGYNYRLPNLNAALACAQLEQLNDFIVEKRNLSNLYQFFFKNSKVIFKSETINTSSNYWLNTIEFKDINQRNKFLETTNKYKIMTRPAWQLLTTLPMYKDCLCDALENAKYLSDRLVNIPSSVRQ
jgi:perosamine synthetase